jgi:hypothetical protein
MERNLNASCLSCRMMNWTDFVQRLHTPSNKIRLSYGSVMRGPTLIKVIRRDRRDDGIRMAFDRHFLYPTNRFPAPAGQVC